MSKLWHESWRGNSHDRPLKQLSDFHECTQGAEVRRFRLQGIHSTFKASPGYIARFCLEKIIIEGRKITRMRNEKQNNAVHFLNKKKKRITPQKCEALLF